MRHPFISQAERRLCAFSRMPSPSPEARGDAPAPGPETAPQPLSPDVAAAERARLATSRIGGASPDVLRSVVTDLRTTAPGLTGAPAPAPGLPGAPAAAPTAGPAAGPAVTPRARLDRDITEASAILNNPAASGVEKLTALVTFIAALAAKAKATFNGTVDTAPAAPGAAPAAGPQAPANGPRQNGRPGWNGNRGGADRPAPAGGRRRPAGGGDDMDDDRGGRRRRRPERDGGDARLDDRDRPSDPGRDRGGDAASDSTAVAPERRDRVEFDRDDPAYVDNVPAEIDKETEFREGKQAEREDVAAERRGIDDEIDDLMMEKRALKRDKRRADRDEREDIQDQIDEINDRLRTMRAEVRDLKADIRRLSTEINLSTRYERDLSREQGRRDRLLARNAPADGKPSVAVEGVRLTATYPEGTDLNGAIQALRQRTAAGGAQPDMAALDGAAAGVRIEGNTLSFDVSYTFWEQQVIRAVMEGLKKVPEAVPAATPAPEASPDVPVELAGFPTEATVGTEVQGNINKFDTEVTGTYVGDTGSDPFPVEITVVDGQVSFTPDRPGKYTINAGDKSVTIDVKAADAATPETPASEVPEGLRNAVDDVRNALRNEGLDAAKAIAAGALTEQARGFLATNESNPMVVFEFVSRVNADAPLAGTDGTYDLTFDGRSFDLTLRAEPAAPATAERTPETPELQETRRLARDVLNLFEYQDETMANAALGTLNGYVYGLPPEQQLVVGPAIAREMSPVPANISREMHRLTYDEGRGDAPFELTKVEAAPEADPSSAKVLEVPERASRGEEVTLTLTGTRDLQLFIDSESGVNLDPMVRTANADFLLEPVAGRPGSFKFTAYRPGEFAFNAIEFIMAGVPPRKVMTVS